jgi:hypothetical protein
MELIRGFKFKRGVFGDNFDYSDIDNMLNKSSNQIPTVEQEPQLVELFYRATQNLVKEKFNIE